MRGLRSILASLLFAAIAFAAGGFCAAAQDLADAINQHRLENAAQAFEDQKLYERAVEDWDELVRTYPNQAEWLSGSCRERAVWGQELDRALADCNTAVQLAPGDADVLDSRGFIHFRRNEFDAALGDFQAALDIGAPNTSLFMRGLTRIRLGQTTAGELDVSTAAARDPGIVSRFSNFGVVLETSTSQHPTDAAASARTPADQEPLTKGTEPQYLGFDRFLQYRFGASPRQIRQTAPSATWRESDGGQSLAGAPPLTIGGTPFGTDFEFYETNNHALHLEKVTMEYKSNSDTADQCVSRYESVVGAVERDLGHLLTEVRRPTSPRPDLFSYDASDGIDNPYAVEQYVGVEGAPPNPYMPMCDVTIVLRRTPGDDGSDFDDTP